MDLENQEKMCALFALYQELFTDNQKELFMSYYYDDMSLQEIAENLKVSRNAIYSQIKRIENQLVQYEEKLKLHKYYIDLEELLNSNLSIDELKNAIRKLGGN